MDSKILNVLSSSHYYCFSLRIICVKRERDAYYTTTPRESLCPFPMTTTFDEKGKEEEDHEDEGDDGGSSSKNDDKKITSSSSSFAALPEAKVSVSRLLCVVVGRLEKRHFSILCR